MEICGDLTRIQTEDVLYITHRPVELPLNGNRMPPGRLGLATKKQSTCRKEDTRTRHSKNTNDPTGDHRRNPAITRAC